MSSTTAGRTFYDRQVGYLKAKDVDGLVDNHYNDDAVLVRFDSVIKGKDALKQFFHQYVEMLGDIEVESTDQFAETEDTIFFEATVKSKLGRAQVYDAWVLKNGKISYHFGGMK
jgi:hypothetical protein